MWNEFTRHRLLKWIIGYFFVLLLFKWYNGVLPYQLANAPLFDVSIDNTFWLFHLTGMPSWIMQQKVLLIFLELLLVALGVILFFKSNPKYVTLFLILYIFLDLLQQSYSGTLTKISVIPVIVMLPFCFSKSLFSFVWQFPRYYLVYLMVSAGLFKIMNGGLWHVDQMTNILINQHLDLLYFDSHHISRYISNVLVQYPILAYVGYVLMSAVECSFLVLVFTRKKDRIMIFLLVLFCFLIYFTLRINTLEILYLIFPLLPYFKINQ